MAAAGWAVAALALLAGVPLFLCMPPWNDVTLHDMVVRTILRGGVPYRDVFDTNLPGIDWSMAVVRWLFGWSYEVLRAVDLLVIGAIVALLCVWVGRCGGTGYTVAWLVASAALFYPFTSEFNHVQRDPWMMMPAVAAALLRVRRIAVVLAPPSFLGEGVGGLGSSDPTPQPPPPRGEGEKEKKGLGSGSSLLEGFVWGLAVWVKPHVVIPAFAVWAVSVVLLARHETRRRILADFTGLILGGLCAGVPGVLWIVGTGAWPDFLDIFLNWNPDYLSEAGSLWGRFNTVFDCFRPWSLLHYVAIPLALLALWEARVWSRRAGEPAKVPGARWFYLPAASEREVAARALLAACYLAWIVQVVFLQKAFDYVHVPLTFLGMAVVAGQRWCFGFVYLLWFVATGVLVNLAEAYPAVAPAVRALDPGDVRLKFEKHPIADWEVMRLWPRCWSEGGSPEMRDRLGQYTDVHCGTKWCELEKVADYLRKVDPPLGPGELNCWHDSTHPLYLTLNLDPATRYMHYGTAFGIRSKRERIAGEVANSRQRYVVSDLLRVKWDRHAVYEPWSWQPGDPLPVWIPPNERQKFPWNQPVVFRAGRYVVHKIDPTKPLGVIRVPDWEKLDRIAEFGPDE